MSSIVVSTITTNNKKLDEVTFVARARSRAPVHLKDRHHEQNSSSRQPAASPPLVHLSRLFLLCTKSPWPLEVRPACAAPPQKQSLPPDKGGGDENRANRFGRGTTCLLLPRVAITTATRNGPTMRGLIPYTVERALTPLAIRRSRTCHLYESQPDTTVVRTASKRLFYNGRLWR